MCPEDYKAPSKASSQDDLGGWAGDAIRRSVQKILNDAERQARKIEQDAKQHGERAALQARDAAREEAQREQRQLLDQAETRAAAIVNAAEEQAASVRKRAGDELSRARQRSVQEAERSAERARPFDEVRGRGRTGPRCADSWAATRRRGPFRRAMSGGPGAAARPWLRAFPLSREQLAHSDAEAGKLR
jgi:hypothetical protein